MCRVYLTVGRFNELILAQSCYWLGNVNARDMLNLAISQGLSYGNEPMVGGVICWWSSNAGHCAVIEKVIDSNTVKTSESGWNYTNPPIVTENIRTRTGNAWDPPWAGYSYQGIIYPPIPVDQFQDYYILWLSDEGGSEL